jgi:hypothetical protein
MRPGFANLPVAQWTRDEALAHLSATFDQAAVRHPDVMEAYASRLEGQNEATQVEIMRAALRETFSVRHPPPKGYRWQDE